VRGLGLRSSRRHDDLRPDDGGRAPGNRSSPRTTTRPASTDASSVPRTQPTSRPGHGSGARPARSDRSVAMSTRTALLVSPST